MSKMSRTIRKAVIPAAGLGTRFLPATKAQPKEMLPIIDTPAIQLVVEEVVRAGIEDILIITGRHKRALEDHFDRNLELEHLLIEREETEKYEAVRRLGELANIHFIRQGEQKGLGDAVLHAKPHVGDESFLLLLGDSIFLPNYNPSLHLLERFREGSFENLIALEQVPWENVSRYGIAKLGTSESEDLQIDQLIEKPSREEAPSNFAVAARYVLDASIFSLLSATEKDSSGEIQVTHAIDRLCNEGKVGAIEVESKRYDIGSKKDYLETIVDFALHRNEFCEDFEAFLKLRA